LTGAAQAGQKFDELTRWKGASYDGATLKVTEIFSTAHSPANVCLWRLHCCVLDFILLSAMGVAEIAKSTNWKGCPHTFGHVVNLRT